MITSHENFMHFTSFCVLSLSVAWILVDIIRLRRALAGAPGPVRGDQVFGSIIGLACGAIGIAGALRYYLG